MRFSSFLVAASCALLLATSTVHAQTVTLTNSTTTTTNTTIIIPNSSTASSGGGGAVLVSTSSGPAGGGAAGGGDTTTQRNPNSTVIVTPAPAPVAPVSNSNASVPVAPVVPVPVPVVPAPIPAPVHTEPGPNCDKCAVQVPACTNGGFGGINTWVYLPHNAEQSCNELFADVRMFQRFAKDKTCFRTINSFLCQVSLQLHASCHAALPSNFDSECQAAVNCLDATGLSLAGGVPGNGAIAAAGITGRNHKNGVDDEKTGESQHIYTGIQGTIGNLQNIWNNNVDHPNGAAQQTNGVCQRLKQQFIAGANSNGTGPALNTLNSNRDSNEFGYYFAPHNSASIASVSSAVVAAVGALAVVLAAAF